LNNLGALLYETGYRSAALTAYGEVVKRHPQNPTGHINLANVLLEQGDFAEARQHAETALRLDPKNKAAHQVMAGICFEQCELDKATHHRRLGYEGQPAIKLPYRGERKPISLLLLVSAVGGNIPVRHLLDDRIFETTVVYADYWDPKTPLPRHDLVFNSIGDADRCRAALEDAARLLERASAPIINPPASVLVSGRADNARRLAHVPDVRAPMTMDFARSLLSKNEGASALHRSGFRFPVLLRAPGFHTGRHFVRVESEGELFATAKALPASVLTAIEYLNASGADGMTRKYRVMFVNGRAYPLHLAISNDWKVHYFTSAMADNAAYRDEERRFLSDMAGTIGVKAMAGLQRVREILALDYAGIDFGLNAARELLLFEANATMVVNLPDRSEQWDYRREAVLRIHQAVRTMLQEKAVPNLPNPAAAE
jgi:glutathione synthase/RimK-type ligase-like ATP-grasp enzyme